MYNLVLWFFECFLAMARILKDYPFVSLKLEELSGKIDFSEIFGRCGPVHIEIGTGKATFLLEQGQAQSDVNFLGIEKARKYYRHAVDRIGRWGLTNVRITRTDAAEFLANFVEDKSVSCFHIYFPDPWPKKRHHKRRFLCPTNLEQLIRCLIADGQLKIATDHNEYFQEIKKLLAGYKDTLKEMPFTTTAGAQAGEYVGTNYERKYVKEKRDIYCIAAKKF